MLFDYCYFNYNNNKFIDDGESEIGIIYLIIGDIVLMIAY